MLDALRRGAASWVLKPLLLLLVLAFIVWGIADSFTRVGVGALARVGGAEISVDEYQRTYGMVMDNFARRFGRRPTPDEVRLRGLDRSILQDLVNTAAIDQHARELGLGLSPRAVVEAVEKDPTFQSDGRFNPGAFENFLRQIGHNERSFLALRRKEMVRQQLTQSMFQDITVPGELVRLVHGWLEETRRIQHFTIDPGKVVKLEEPDEARLKEVYEAQKRQFVSPELRHLAVLLLTVEEAKKLVEVKDEELRKAYEADKEGFNVPERRRIQQIAFKDKASAEAAARTIAGGKSFLDVGKETGASETDIDLGLVARSELLDARIAEAAFKLDKDKVSAPVEGRFTIVLLRVVAIEPGKVRSFEDVREEIRDRIATGRANEVVRKLHDQVDDGRAAGKPLKEIAAELKLKHIDVAATDRLGRTPDGKPAYEGPDAADILRTGFEGRVGVENEAVDLDEGGYAWVDTLAVTPERQRPFEEVNDDVRRVWRELETSRALSDYASKLIERAGKGEALASLAAEAGGRLSTSKPFKRTGASDAGLPGATVQRAFSLANGTLASTETSDGKSRNVFRLVEIAPPPPLTKEQADQIATQLRNSLQQDQVSEYVTALRSRFGVTVNEAQFKRMAGGTGDAQ